MSTAEWILGIAVSTIRLSTPLIFAGLGGLLSERSGVINIALEGFMLVGAFSAAVFALVTGSPWLGFFAGGLAGSLFAAIYALFVLRYRSDQIVAGTAINVLAAGITPFVCQVLYGSTNATPGLAMAGRFVSAPMVVSWIAAIVVIAWWRFSVSGLWVRFAGEHPEALETSGISVLRTRTLCVLLSGFLAGLGGASLTTFLSSSFARGISAGRGFMALAAIILGAWKPIPTVLACLLFGLADALQIQLQGVVLWGEDPVPVQFIQILPYIVTLVVLSGFVGGSRAPKRLGIPL